MSDPTKSLFVRLPAAEADRLDQAATTTGRSKRRLVSDAVREHLAGDGLVVGRAALREPPHEVMTLGEAAALLRVDGRALEESAERGEVPARRIGTEWRLSRAAVVAWLDRDGAPA